MRRTTSSSSGSTSIGYARATARRSRRGSLHPLKNPKAPPDPSYLPQYRIPQQAAGLALSARAAGWSVLPPCYLSFQ